MYSLPPWITTAMFGILKYDKNEWLDTVRSWGRNKGHMLTFAAGIERLLLGELSFLYANAYYYFEQKALDPNAPIGLSFFQDITNLHRAMNVVLEGTRHPNAASLVYFVVRERRGQSALSGARFSPEHLSRYRADIQG